MQKKIYLDIMSQPDDFTCGPTCLHAIYNYYGDSIALEQVINEVKRLEDGGTLAVLLGCHALSRGYDVVIYTWDLQVFDPTWFTTNDPDIYNKLEKQMQVKKKAKIKITSQAYVDFLALGGSIKFKDLTTGLIRDLLKHTTPILTGLSATYLYGTPREMQVENTLIYDDVAGEPSGHFVVLCGYNIDERIVMLADPLMPNPISEEPIYGVKLNRLITAIMLGIITFDSNLLVVTPKKRR